MPNHPEKRDGKLTRREFVLKSVETGGLVVLGLYVSPSIRTVAVPTAFANATPVPKPPDDEDPTPTPDDGSGLRITQSNVGPGTTNSSGGSYTLSGSAGQPDAGGPMAGGDYTIEGGFWPSKD